MQYLLESFGAGASSWTPIVVAVALIAATIGVRKIGQLIKFLKAEPTGTDAYASDQSDPEPPLLRELRQETWEATRRTAMVAGGLEGRLLKMLVRITNAKRVLELGCFTGYSALCMAEALPSDGTLITLDKSEKYTEIARKFWTRAGGDGAKIRLIIGRALDSIKKLEGSFDLVFLDADKKNYTNYYEALLPLVRPGGLIVVDNVLGAGLAETWYGRMMSKNVRAIHEFNQHVAKDPRVEKVLLTVRDGVTLIRKK